MKKIILFSLALLASCNFYKKDILFFESYIIHHWSHAERIESVFPESFFPDRSIVSPQMTWKPILKVKGRGFIHCLIYRVPHKRLSRGKGIIKIISAKEKESCSRILDRRPILEIEGVSHFKTYFTSVTERNLKTKITYNPFHLYLSVSQSEEKKEVNLVLPLNNVERGNLINPNKLNKKTKKFKRYDEPWSDSLYPGLSLMEEKAFFNERSSLEDLNYADDKIRFCYRVDEGCNITQEFECQKCRKGWYSIVDFKCPKGGSKLCGTSLCGQRNQPACPRGESFEKTEGKSYCFRGSKAGFCEEGLETYCDENKVLVCR